MSSRPARLFAPAVASPPSRPAVGGVQQSQSEAARTLTPRRRLRPALGLPLLAFFDRRKIRLTEGASTLAVLAEERRDG